MKLRDDIAVVTGCALGLFDGSCTALYISLPHLLNTVIRVLWAALLLIGGYLYLRNQLKEEHETQVKARAVRQQKIQNQWIKEYEQFREEMHGKDRKD